LKRFDYGGVSWVGKVGGECISTSVCVCCFLVSVYTFISNCLQNPIVQGRKKKKNSNTRANTARQQSIKDRGEFEEPPRSGEQGEVDGQRRADSRQ